MRKLLSISALMIAGLNATTATAASWNETLQGDLSNNGLSPNTLLLELGSNAVTGRFGTLGSPDTDYLAITVPTGTMLSSLLLGSGYAIEGVRSFIGVQAGATMTVLPTTSSPADLLGYTHVDRSSAIGTDFLPEIGTGFGAIGFTGPLNAGTYTFWIQETSSRPGTFAYDFVLSAVPEPESYAMLLAGLGFLGLISHHNNKKQK